MGMGWEGIWRKWEGKKTPTNKKQANKQKAKLKMIEKLYNFTCDFY